jgi:hypothetical protein
VWVLLQGTPYIRDIFNLPLHDGRTHVVDLLILILGFLLIVLNEITRRKNYQTETVKVVSQFKIDSTVKCFPINHHNFVNQNILSFILCFLKIIRNYFLNLHNLIAFNRTVLLWTVPGFFIYISSIISESTHLIYFKQYMVFCILIQFIFWGVRCCGVILFLKTIRNGSILFISVQGLLFLLNLIQDGLHQDLIEKNSFPVAMLILSELSRKLGAKNLYKSFIVIGSISAIIGSAKIFFLLLFALLILNKVKLISSSKFIAVLIPYAVILLPFMIPRIITLALNIEIDEVIELGKNRFNINDNIGSLVSRIYSVGYTINQINFLTLFGNNESVTSTVLFWGYPVHNLYVALVYSHGFFFLLVLILYNLAIWRFFQRNAGLGLIFGIIVIYFNDILPMLSLFFIPYIISKADQISHVVERQTSKA